MQSLFVSRHFFPFFLTQVCGAFNDFFFKSAATIFIGYIITTQNSATLITLGSACFVFPFLIFSSLSGELADRFEKTTVIKFIKLIEVMAMLVAAYSFLMSNVAGLFLTLLILGIHAALFGTVKYSILPELVSTNDLIQANAWIEASTTIALLAGGSMGGILILFQHGPVLVSIIEIAIAMLGLTSSFFIPKKNGAASSLPIAFNLIKSSYKVLSYLKGRHILKQTVLIVSWYWGVGIFIQGQLPIFTHQNLYASASVTNFLMIVSSVSIAIGAFLSNFVQKTKINAKFVPYYMMAISISLLAIAFFSAGMKASSSTNLIGLKEFLIHAKFVYILISFLALGIFNGIFVVPLYAIMQYYSEESHRSRVIAACNILNTIVMLSVVGVIFLLMSFKISLVTMYAAFGILNFFVAIAVLYSVNYGALSKLNK